MTTAAALQAALQHHQAGRLSEAETLYRGVLREHPNHFEALRLLGALAVNAGNPRAAIPLLERAAALRPDQPDVRAELAGARQEIGDLEAARAAREAVVRLQPLSAAAYFQLGNVLYDMGRYEEAAAAQREAIRLEPGFVLAHYRLGVTLQCTGRFEEALATCHTIYQLDTNHADAHNSEGNILQMMGRFEDSIGAYRETLRIKPDYGLGHNNLCVALHALDRFDAAVAAGRDAVRCDPKHAISHYNLANALRCAGAIDDAVTAFREAIALQPGYALAYNNLANCYQDQGRMDEAIECSRLSAISAPAAADLHSNLAYSVHFHSDYDPAAILEENLRWDRQHGQKFQGEIRPHANSRDPDRRLRIGYVSADLRCHVVGQNLMPLIREHDRARFEIFIYAGVIRKDSVTDEFRALANHWRDIEKMSDAAAAELIRADEIDILVDLSLHTAENRLPVFARKPAPLQVTYLGYCSTTGLQAMDYRLSDPHLDPPGTDLNCYCERTIRLPRSYWCYQPKGPTPKRSGILPFETAGYLTFGCLNNFAKVSPAALDLWRQILSRRPDSRLLLCAPAGSCREDVRSRFEEGGVVGERIEFVAMQSWEKYLDCIERVDVALDPFPYGGGITTLDALWMGVPVVTLSGRTAVGRGGRSILSNLGLPDLVADTPEHYELIALSLIEQPEQLREWRNTLRTRMETSPLRDAKGFARDVESAYRGIWRDWCAGV